MKCNILESVFFTHIEVEIHHFHFNLMIKKGITLPTSTLSTPEKKVCFLGLFGFNNRSSVFVGKYLLSVTRCLRVYTYYGKIKVVSEGSVSITLVVWESRIIEWFQTVDYVRYRP